MTKKSVCVWRRRAFSLALALCIGFGGVTYTPPAYAFGIPGIVELGPISIGKFIQDFLTQLKQLAIQQIINSTLVRGFTALTGITIQLGQSMIDNDTELAKRDALANQNNTLNAMTNAANIATVENQNRQQVAMGQTAGTVATTNRENAERACRDVSLAAAVETGGVVGTGNNVPRGRPQIVFNRLRGATGPGAVPPNSQMVAEVAAAVVNNEAAAGNASAIGAPGAQGPLTQYGDQVTTHLMYWASPQDSLGAAGAAGLSGNLDPNKAWLDTQAGDLMAQSGPSLNLFCFQNEASGNGRVLGGFVASFCAPGQTWESYFVNGDGRADAKRIDMATAFTIRDYIVPPPLSPFRVGAYKALIGGNVGMREIFAKRQAYSNMRSIVFSSFNRMIMDRAQQKLTRGTPAYEAFNANWKKVLNDENATAPENSSLKLRQDIKYRYYHSKAFIDRAAADGGTVSGALAAGASVGLQKDILYALERIELILTTQLANDLNDRRNALEGAIQNANGATSDQDAPSASTSAASGSNPLGTNGTQ